MEKCPGLTKVFYKGDRTIGDQLRKNLVRELNYIDPPVKDAFGWKKGFG